MTALSSNPLAMSVEQRLLDRNPVFNEFFARESERLAAACREMSQRFLAGGRLLAFGRGAYMTDAQHVSVEFVHPVIVGKRALPAIDISANFRPWLRTLLRPEDMVMGFGPPEGDPEVWEALDWAYARGAMTFALPGIADNDASYSVTSPTHDPFIHQELIELLYHTLWETVHVFFEHRELGHDVGAAGFLYPFLGSSKAEQPDLLGEVASSIKMKVADDEALRGRVADEESECIAAAIVAIHDRVSSGGKLVIFGNGGSATDANDWALDCIDPPQGYRAIPAISLSMEPANVTAIANDVGTDVIFVRQLIAHGETGDVAVAISTSGGSRNVIAALEEARKRNMMTVALLGYDGGEIKRRGIADHIVVVQSDYIPRIQEVQASIYHVIREGLEVIHRGKI
ncbi:MAG: SIS domain-containing protein [Gemmatimonadales bacterium]